MLKKNFKKDAFFNVDQIFTKKAAALVSLVGVSTRVRLHCNVFKTKSEKSQHCSERRLGTIDLWETSIHYSHFIH